MDPDSQLMMRFREGERTAFEMLYHKYHRQILNFSYRFLGNSFDAEEVVQETFIQVYQAASGYRPLTKFSTWLYTIAKNICLNRIRKRDWEVPERMDPADEEEFSPEDRHISDRPTPDQELEQKELSAIIQEAVQSLPESLRLPLILRRYQELSYEEIAQVMGCPITTVKMRIYRATTFLARILAPYIKEGSI